MQTIKQRQFADTGWFAVPIELFSFGLSSNTIAVYSFLACEADKGHDPPPVMEMAMACSMTIEDVNTALDVMARRGLLVMKNATDWLLTEPETWIAE